MKDRIKEIRKSIGLSQGEFAQRLSDVTLGPNVVEETVKKWELGTELPLPSAIEALAFLSNRSVKWLQSEVESNDKGQEFPVDERMQDLNTRASEEKVKSDGPKQKSNVIQFPDNDESS